MLVRVGLGGAIGEEGGDSSGGLTLSSSWALESDESQRETSKSGADGRVTSRRRWSGQHRTGEETTGIFLKAHKKFGGPEKIVFFFSTQSKNHVNWCFNPMWKIPMTSFFCSWKTGSVILHALGRWSKLTPAEFQHFLSVEIGRFSMNPQLGGWSLTFGVIGDLHFCSFCTLGLVM